MGIDGILYNRMGFDKRHWDTGKWNGIQYDSVTVWDITRHCMEWNGIQITGFGLDRIGFGME